MYSLAAAASAQVLQVLWVKSMLQYSLLVYAMIIQSRLTPSVHCVLSIPNSVVDIVVTNYTPAKYMHVTPFEGDMYLRN
jgi:hypothetical protein